VASGPDRFVRLYDLEAFNLVVHVVLVLGVLADLHDVDRLVANLSIAMVYLNLFRGAATFAFRRVLRTADHILSGACVSGAARQVSIFQVQRYSLQTRRACLGQ
jgi:hypothetical protein